MRLKRSTVLNSAFECLNFLSMYFGLSEPHTQSTPPIVLITNWQSLVEIMHSIMLPAYYDRLRIIIVADDDPAPSLHIQSRHLPAELQASICWSSTDDLQKHIDEIQIARSRQRPLRSTSTQKYWIYNQELTLCFHRQSADYGGCRTSLRTIELHLLALLAKSFPRHIDSRALENVLYDFKLLPDSLAPLLLNLRRRLLNVFLEITYNSLLGYRLSSMRPRKH